MDPIRLWHLGLPLDLIPVTDEAESRIYGYGITCPSCNRDFFLNTGIGRKPDHHLAHNPADPSHVTILPPITCPFRCGWCVRIIDSIAYRCRRRADG